MAASWWRGLAGLVGRLDAIADRITQAVEEPAAAVNVAPAFGVPSLRIAAHVQELSPRRVIQCRRVVGPSDVCLPAIAEFILGADATPRTDNQQHQCATAAAAASSISRPVSKRPRANGAAIGCGSPRAIVAAKTCPDPGVALNPPVPQPQFTYNPGTGVSPMIGERSGVTSTMPPQLRSMRSRRKVGNNSQIASSVCSATCKPPAWLY